MWKVGTAERDVFPLKITRAVLIPDAIMLNPLIRFALIIVLF